MTIPDLSIIIPAYNEGDDFGPRLERLDKFLDQRQYGNVEVLIMLQSDDPSDTKSAATSELGSFANCRIINLGKRAGKGAAVRAGMFEAKGRYRLFMDADLATPLHHLDDVKRLMDDGARVGIAVRDLWSIHKNFQRRMISTISNLAVQMLLLPGIKDTQCGFKVFEAEAAEAIFSRQTITTWSFDVEILSIARYLKYPIKTFDVPDWHDPKGEGAGLVGDSPLKVAIREAMDPLKVRLNLWRGRYKQPVFQYEPKGQ